VRALFRNGYGFFGGFCVGHVNHPFLRGLRARRFITLVQLESKLNLP
jgi:hypothetical protein